MPDAARSAGRQALLHPVTRGDHDADIAALRRQRLTPAEIAAQVRCSAATATRRIAKLQLGPRNPAGRKRHPVTQGGHDGDIQAWLRTGMAHPDIAARLLCSVRSLQKRIRTIQAAACGTNPARHVSTVVVGPILFSKALRIVTTHQGVRIRLTSSQYKMLEVLVEAEGREVPWQDISMRIYGRPRDEREDRGLRAILHGLRKSLPADEHGAPLIQSVRCLGLWIRKESVNHADP